MAVTTKKLFPATTNATTTVFSPVGIQLNNQDDLDVYVTLSGGTRVLQLRQSTGSTAQSSHPQVNNTDGLYFPAVSAGTTLINYQLSTDNNTITFNSALPQGAVVFCERRTRDADSTYTTFASGSTIRATDLNNSSTESNFTAQDGRNKALTIEGVLFRGDQPSTNFVTTDHIVAGTIVNGDIADNSVTSSKIVDGTIVSDDLANNSVITSKILNDAVVTAKIDNQAVTTGKIADLNVTRGKLEADAIDSSKLADNAVNSEHYVDGSIDHVHLANDIIDGDNIQDDVVNSEHIAAGALDNEHYAAGSITSDKLNAATVITASEQGSATTNDTSFLTSAAADARFFNISSGDTIKDGQTFPDNDTTIATTAAINDRIIDLVDDVGGFVPIANETSFPTSNPDVNNGTGTLVSIKSISSTRTPSSGTVTIANGAGSGNTVSITGCGSTVLSAGFGVIVETTSTLHTYAFHRLVPKATEVTTVAGISSDVTTVSNNNTNVTTVAGIDSDVTTVAGIASNVTAVANNATNINAVQANATNINAVNANSANINTVAGSNSAVNSVAGSITSVNTAASNLTAINKFGDTYQVASSNPTTDGGGNAVAEGDLYFNTSANRLKVYDGANWVDGVIASGGGAQTTGDTFTGDVKFNDNVKILVGTGSDLEIFHHASNGSFINDAGTSTLKIQTGGSTKLEIVSTGIDVSGNITLSGTVDGRDVAADGTSLDSFEAGNVTTDVTNGNIKLTPNGTGVAEVRGAGGNDGTLQLNCSANSHGVKIKSPPHSAGASYTLTLPTTDGNNNQVLKTDGNGNLDWVNVGTAFLSDDSVTTVKIEDDAVTIDKIANDAVGADQLASNSVVSASIVDGSIVNADVNASAAIAGTKIAPDFGSQNIATTGTVGSGNITVTDTDPTINFVDTNHNPDFRIQRSSTGLAIQDTTNSNATRFLVKQNGDIDITGNLDAQGGVDVTGNITVTGTVDGVDVAQLHTTVGTKFSKAGGDTITGDFTIASGTTNKNINVDVSDKIRFDDNLKATFGNSDDLQIFHAPENSFIQENGSGNLKIQASDLILADNNGTEFFRGYNNGQVELSHNGNKKFETTSGGATVTGTLTATSFSGDGSNLTGVSSAEIYGFNTDANGNLIVTTTNGGADDISGTTFDAFEDVVFAATGISFSVNASGNLIATI